MYHRQRKIYRYSALLSQKLTTTIVPPDRSAPPQRLPADAQALWPEIIDELAARGRLQHVPQLRIERYCQFWAQFLRVTGFINAEGQVQILRNDKGEVTKQEIAPEAVQQLKLETALSRLEKDFGLIEKSTEANSAKEVPQSPFDELRASLQARLAGHTTTHN